MADPGFPVGGGGADPLGGANLRHVHFSAKTYVKMKEIDPVGGGGVAVPPPLDPPMHLYSFPYKNLIFTKSDRQRIYPMLFTKMCHRF